jgi:hypothetical protein
MTTRERRQRLDDRAVDWLRMRFTTARGQVASFTAQYETVLDDTVLPVVRYDTAHGFAHRDRLNRRGELVENRALPSSMSYAEALNFAERDIRLNWRRYKREFFGAEP